MSTILRRRWTIYDFTCFAGIGTHKYFLLSLNHCFGVFAFFWFRSTMKMIRSYLPMQSTWRVSSNTLLWAVTMQRAS